MISDKKRKINHDCMRIIHGCDSVHNEGSRWSLLGEDILSKILEKLGIQQIAYLRLVCKKWNLSIQYVSKELKSNFPWTNEILQQAAKQFKFIQKLDLQNPRNLRSLYEIAEFSCLRHLRLHNIEKAPVDDIYNVLMILKNLESLSLTACLTLLQLHLPVMKNLRIMDLTACKNLKAFQLRESLPRLNRLNLRECLQIHDWEFFNKMPALEAVDLSNTLADDDTMEEIVALKHLNILVLTHCKCLSNDGFIKLLSLDTQTNIFIDGCTSITNFCILERRNPLINVIKYQL